MATAETSNTETAMTNNNLNTVDFSKDDIQGLAENMSFQELSSIANSDPKLLDIFLSAVVAEEQADIAKSKNDVVKRSLDVVRKKSEDLWCTVEQKQKIVSYIIDISKKAIGEAIKNMETLEQARNSVEETMKYEIHFATEEKQKSDADLRRANEIMAMADMRAEKAAESLKKALEEKKAADAEVQKAIGLIKGAEYQLKVNEDFVNSTKEKAEKEIGAAEEALKDAIENSFKLEVKSAAEIEEAKMEKANAEEEATEYNKVLEDKEEGHALSENVAKRAMDYRKQVMLDACAVASTLKKKDENILFAEEMLVATQMNKNDVQSDSSASNSPQIEENSSIDSSPLEENEVMASLLARLDAIQQLNPANE